jgi:nucleoside-diphosphate-sugar epimerase
MSPPIIVWPGESNPIYSIVYASDAVECAVLAATSDRAQGQVYNVAPPHAIRFREFGAAMVRAMGKSKPQVTIPYSVAYAWCGLMESWARLRRVKEMPYLTRSGLRFLNRGMYLDGTKVREELGWEPKVSIDEGTRRYVEWRRSQLKN